MAAGMNWELDREHEEFRASVRAFVDRHVRPVVEESEEAGRPPAALLKEMGGAGLLGLGIPEEYGGDARVLRIGGGTDEIQLEILAKGLPE
jgi:alkylation response protein AidB-like acyl-CoA dehydrogenase